MEMEQLLDKANIYAEKNTLLLLKEAFAKIYADGYRDGYKDCEENKSVLFNDKTEYIDLGLPSGTLWAADYEKDDGAITYLSYNQASSLNIPTMEQWEEILNSCKWEYDISNGTKMVEARCVGPNGNYITFICTGMINAEKFVRHSQVKALFWVYNDEINDTKNAAQIYYHYIPYNAKLIKEVTEVFPGYKLPVRLVRK